MKRFALLLALILAAVLLAGYSSSSLASNVGGQLQQDPLSLPSGYNPASEEDGSSYLPDTQYNEYGQTVYAGATPIPLDPIDMPTPTPRPSLTFSYGAVMADRLGLAFEAPVGWYVDTTAADAIVLTDPVAYDNVNATLTIRILPVDSDYKLADVKTEVRNMLSEIGQYNYSEWTTTDLASRTLLKKDGYYANYRGELYDGTIVRGRVMVALLDGNKVISVHMSAPGWFNESYMNVVSHMRDTLQMIK
ncbi:MAG: hypothetical protein E7329_07620 [Clostridiales bacterium]|nr:hypothetical protein [Clostridiales bacterium]